VATVPEERWPRWIGLGNELDWFITPAQYAADLASLAHVLDLVFQNTTAGARPRVYAPCDASWPPMPWQANFLDTVRAAAANGSHLLDAFSYHSYTHTGVDVATMDAEMGSQINASAAFFDGAQAVFSAHAPSGTKVGR
jgi:hypothetical protein